VQSKSHDEKKPLPGHSISEGTCIGQYRILSGVVSGDQCEIYTAVETALGREVALYFRLLSISPMKLLPGEAPMPLEF